jgi:hypothetical protein
LLWLKSELSEKISLSENFFNSVGLLVDYIDQQHQKYRTNRYAFDFSLANKEKFPPEAAKLTWPGSPQGF